MRVPRRGIAARHAGVARLHFRRGPEGPRTQYRGDLVPTRQPPGRTVAFPGEPAAADDTAEPARVSTGPARDPRQPAAGAEPAGRTRPVSIKSVGEASPKRRL